MDEKPQQRGVSVAIRCLVFQALSLYKAFVLHPKPLARDEMSIDRQALPAWQCRQAVLETVAKTQAPDAQGGWELDLVASKKLKLCRIQGAEDSEGAERNWAQITV